MRPRPTGRAAVLVAAVIASVVTLAACTVPVSGTPTSGTPAGTPTPPEATTTTVRQRPLVVETVFGQVDLDPAQQFGSTDEIVAKALYQTLTTFSGSDQTQPGLAQYTISPEGNWLTLRLREGATFSDGTPVTTDDVIFTLSRAQGLGGPTSRVLGTITMTKVDARTMTITSPGANFALPAILANPAFGILDAAVVKKQGGTIGPHDLATSWLQTHSAGSGPYVLAGRTSHTITLRANPHWPGPPPAHPEVVLKDATPARQAADLESGAADIALDLSPRQAEAIGRAHTDLSVEAHRSSTVAYLALGRSPKVSPVTADPDFAKAVRLGIDRVALARVVAGGAIPATGLIPQGIVGALPPTRPTPTHPPTTRDVAAAKAALKRSSYRGQALTLVYAQDQPIEGVPTGQLADAVARQLRQVGIDVRPQGVPASTFLAAYRAGTLPFALAGFTPDYPGPENDLLFAPGHELGLQAGWQLRDSPTVDELTIAALNSVGADRVPAYRAWQRAMNAAGPFVPLVQPDCHYGHGQHVTSLSTNPIWTIDLAQTR